MYIRHSLKILILFISVYSYSQTNDTLRKPDYLSVETGLIMDGYNSTGNRTFIEYQKDLRNNWQFGLSYEYSRHQSESATDHFNSLKTSLSLVSLNLYYKLNLIKNRIFWTTGLGVGAVHAMWENNDKYGGTINGSITLNIRITKRIYFESSPLIILIPINRAYFSTMNIENYKSFYAITFFPFGLKYRL